MTSKIIVTVNEGKIKGIKNKSIFSGTEFFSFFGVPYGQSTGKNARFKDPIPVKPWKNFYDATEQKDGCIQLSPKRKCVMGSENCLYNNIHTPKLPSKGDLLKAVIVNIHQGSLYFGSPETYYYGSPDYIMHNDIVYVSIGYRLHLLGFLNLGLKECSGNQALKDIVLGLKWIKNNIAAFGGDPENITLLGSSSGSIIIHSLMLSPTAKGLFHKAILMGGFLFLTISPHWEDNLWLTIKHAQACGYEQANENEKKQLLSYYKKVHLPDILHTKLQHIMKQMPTSSIPLYPLNFTLDTAGENPIFPESPRKLIDSMPRIPIMVGLCENETAMGFTRGMKERIMPNFKSTFRQNCWGWAHHMTDDQIEAMFEEIKSFYLDGNDINDAPLTTLIDIQSDGAYSEIYETLIDVISAELPSSAYVYKFQFEDQFKVNTLKDVLSSLYDEPIKGTIHSCDYSYWACTIDDWQAVEMIKNMPDRNRKMINTFTKLLTTFAKTGNPNYEGLEVEWKPSTPEKPYHLTINDSLNLVDGKIDDKRMRFWESLKNKYGKE